MKLFKYAIYYTFIGFYQSGLFIKSIPTKLQSQRESSDSNAGLRVKTTLLRTAFRSIL